MKKMARLVLIGLVALAFVFGMGTGKSLWAVSFTLYGINDSSLRAYVDFTYMPAAGKIDISITNTSLYYDPRFTAFAFNVPDNVTGISDFSGPTGWSGTFYKNNINTPMDLGYFDIGGITGQNFNGGKPNYGIPLNNTFNFSFVLSGTSLNSLTESSFLSLFSYDPPDIKTEGVQFFVGRFQNTGQGGKGSDVAVVPIPSTLLLLGSGLLGVVGLARRRKK